MRYRLLDWDTGFFGHRIAELVWDQHSSDKLPVCAERLRQDGIDVAYLRLAQPLSGSAAGTPGLRAMGSLRRYQLTASDAPSKMPCGLRIVARANKMSVARLEVLAISSGRYSRFTLDPGFDQGRVRDMYRVWLRRALSGDQACRILADQDEPRALVTLEDHDGEAAVGLLAVADQYRRKGCGQLLCMQALQWARERGSDSVYIRTQARNQAACALYVAAGGQLVDETFMYHLWLR